jgi:hypothetical protein
MYQLAFLIFAPIIGGNLLKIGRKTALIAGYSLTIAATMGFGLIVYVDEE